MSCSVPLNLGIVKMRRGTYSDIKAFYNSNAIASIISRNVIINMMNQVEEVTP